MQLFLLCLSRNLISNKILWYRYGEIEWENLHIAFRFGCFHYSGVIMSAMAFQITSLTIVYSIVYSDADQRKHHSSASLAFVRGIHRGAVNSSHKWPVTRKVFPFDDVTMFFQASITSMIEMKLYPVLLPNKIGNPCASCEVYQQHTRHPICPMSVPGYQVKFVIFHSRQRQCLMAFWPKDKVPCCSGTSKEKPPAILS